MEQNLPQKPPYSLQPNTMKQIKDKQRPDFERLKSQDFQKDIRILKNQFAVQDPNDENEPLKQENKYLLHQISQLQQKCNELQIVAQNYSQKYTSLQKSKEILEQKLTDRRKLAQAAISQPDQYDIQISFNSIDDLLQGFQIKSQSHYQLGKITNAKLVGYLGNFNSGKSHIMSKNTDKYFPQGDAQQTSGLNIALKTTKATNFWHIDTFGAGEPSLIYKDIQKLEDQLYSMIPTGEDQKKEEYNEKYNALLNDITTKTEEINRQKREIFKQQKLSERFVQGYIFSQCNAIIYTVGPLTRQDQQTISSICYKFKEFQEKGATQELFIIHNFKDKTSKEELDFFINKDIRGSFSVKLQVTTVNGTVECCYFQDYSYGNRNPVIHLVYAAEGSEAGDKYNEATLAYLKNKLENLNSNSVNIEILENIKNFTENSVEDYFQIDKKSQDDQIKQMKWRFEVEVQNENSQQECLFYVYSKELQQLAKKQLITTHDQTYDIFDQLIEDGKNEESFKYDVWENDTKIVIQIEAAGLSQEDAEKLVNDGFRLDRAIGLIDFSIKREEPVIFQQENLKKRPQANNKIIYDNKSIKVMISDNVDEIKYKKREIRIYNNCILIEFQKKVKKDTIKRVICQQQK